MAGAEAAGLAALLLWCRRRRALDLLATNLVGARWLNFRVKRMQTPSGIPLGSTVQVQYRYRSWIARYCSTQ